MSNYLTLILVLLIIKLTISSPNPSLVIGIKDNFFHEFINLMIQTYGSKQSISLPDKEIKRNVKYWGEYIAGFNNLTINTENLNNDGFLVKLDDGTFNFKGKNINISISFDLHLKSDFYENTNIADILIGGINLDINLIPLNSDIKKNSQEISFQIEKIKVNLKEIEIEFQDKHDDILQNIIEMVISDLKSDLILYLESSLESRKDKLNELLIQNSIKFNKDYQINDRIKINFLPQNNALSIINSTLILQLESHVLTETKYKSTEVAAPMPIKFTSNKSLSVMMNQNLINSILEAMHFEKELNFELKSFPSIGEVVEQRNLTTALLDGYFEGISDYTHGSVPAVLNFTSLTPPNIEINETMKLSTNYSIDVNVLIDKKFQTLFTLEILIISGIDLVLDEGIIKIAQPINFHLSFVNVINKLGFAPLATKLKEGLDYNLNLISNSLEIFSNGIFRVYDFLNLYFPNQFNLVDFKECNILPHIGYLELGCELLLRDK